MDKDTMSSETFSLLVWYWHDMQTHTTQLQIVRADTGEEIHLSDGSLLLRVSANPDTPVVRCFIRHMGSGREVYFQSGKRVRDFVVDCLLNKEIKPEPPDPGKAGV
jgi:hypothetical protein